MQPAHRVKFRVSSACILLAVDDDSGCIVVPIFVYFCVVFTHRFEKKSIAQYRIGTPRLIYFNIAIIIIVV